MLCTIHSIHYLSAIICNMFVGIIMQHKHWMIQKNFSIIYRGSSSPSPSPSDELLMELYCEFLLFSIRRKLPIAKIVRRWRWKMPWYNASRRARRSSLTSIDEVKEFWCGIILEPNRPVEERGSVFSLIIVVNRMKVLKLPGILRR